MSGSIQERLTRLFRERLPDAKSIWGVYATIVFLVYSWTLITSFYKLPSWMFYLTIDQILSIYAYSFSVNLLESILFLAGVLSLEFALFPGMGKNNEFQSRSVLMALIVLASFMLRLILFRLHENPGAFVSGELLWWGVTLPLSLFVAVFGPKINIVKNILEGISDRAVVFLYIYPPLSMLSLIVLLIRNIN